MKIGIFQINPLVGDITGNVKKITQALQRAKIQKVKIAIFPELAIPGYPPEDLLFFKKFIQKTQQGIKEISRHTENLLAVVGTIREEKGKIYNSAVLLADKKLLGFQDKSLLPDYDVFNESRYFTEGEKSKIFQYRDKKIGVLLCEDAWAHGVQEIENFAQSHYHRDPVMDLKKEKPDLVLVLSASPYYFKKKAVRIEINKKIVKKLKCPLIYCNQVGGNDTQVFDGSSFYLDEKGALKAICQSFKEDDLIIEDSQTKKSRIKNLKSSEKEHVADLYEALVLGVKDYFTKQHLNKALIGISGGIDSAITACIAKDALGAENVLMLSMPSRFSSAEGIEDAELLAHNLNIKVQDLPIDGLFQTFLDYLSPFFYGLAPSTAEENLQARIRGMLLMAISNKWGYIVLSTGNKSEIAMGYVTLYGDMCGGLAVLSDVSKTMIYKLAKHINSRKKIIPQDIIQKPPSAELKKDQKDQDDLPNYKLVDLVLKEYVEEHKSTDEIIKQHKLNKKLIQKMIKKIHWAEYKRRQAAPGIIVTKKAFGKGRNFPIVQGWV